jgi:hypothetical protein
MVIALDKAASNIKASDLRMTSNLTTHSLTNVLTDRQCPHSLAARTNKIDPRSPLRRLGSYQNHYQNYPHEGPPNIQLQEAKFHLLKGLQSLNARLVLSRTRQSP